MNWVNTIVEEIKPAFGGVPTFCEDPDNLLDLPELREALRGVGVTLSDWDGQPSALIPLKELPADEMPLLVVGDGAARHIVEACLTDFRWLAISIGQLMPKFAQDVVKDIPVALWDSLLILHGSVRSPRTSQETATLIGRALYGVDPEFLKHGDGWLRLLTRIAVTGESLPVPLAKAITETSTAPEFIQKTFLPDALVNVSDARNLLLAMSEKSPDTFVHASPVEKLLLKELREPYVQTDAPAHPIDLLAQWEQCKASPLSVLEFAVKYGKAQALGQLSEETRLEINHHFVTWLKSQYAYIQSTPNPAILRLPTLLKTLDEEVGNDRLLLIVVDALGLAAWENVQECWMRENIIKSVNLRSVFAVLPTITTLSRRAIFEGTLPARFSNESHSQRLERKLWKARFGAEGEYFSVEERTGLEDSFAQGKRRLCVVDVTWDKRGHALDPKYDSVEAAINSWATKTSLSQVVVSALQSNYRVVLTADHGQTVCTGRGRANVGVLSEERSKRIMLFNDRMVCNSFMKEWTDNFRPVGLPQELHPLFASNFDSFDLQGATTVSHGGLSIEEVIVPVVEVMA